MEAASVKELKQELQHQDPVQLRELVLRLARFKKENKELLTYLLFKASDEEIFKMEVKEEIDRAFSEINSDSFYYMKKSIRKILRTIKKYGRYSGKKETEIELLIYFLQKMDDFSPSVYKDKTLQNLFARQLALVRRNMERLHEDIQYDLNLELQAIKGCRSGF